MSGDKVCARRRHVSNTGKAWQGGEVASLRSFFHESSPPLQLLAHVSSRWVLSTSPPSASLRQAVSKRSPEYGIFWTRRRRPRARDERYGEEKGRFAGVKDDAVDELAVKMVLFDGAQWAVREKVLGTPLSSGLERFPEVLGKGDVPFHGTW